MRTSLQQRSFPYERANPSFLEVLELTSHPIVVSEGLPDPFPVEWINASGIFVVCYPRAQKNLIDFATPWTRTWDTNPNFPIQLKATSIKVEKFGFLNKKFIRLRDLKKNHDKSLLDRHRWTHPTLKLKRSIFEATSPDRLYKVAVYTLEDGWFEAINQYRIYIPREGSQILRMRRNEEITGRDASTSLNELCSSGSNLSSSLLSPEMDQGETLFADDPALLIAQNALNDFSKFNGNSLLDYNVPSSSSESTDRELMISKPSPKRMRRSSSSDVDLYRVTKIQLDSDRFIRNAFITTAQLKNVKDEHGIQDLSRTRRNVEEYDFKVKYKEILSNRMIGDQALADVLKLATSQPSDAAKEIMLSVIARMENRSREAEILLESL